MDKFIEWFSIRNRKMEALVITHNARKQFIETIKPLEKNLISKRGKSCARELPLVLLLFLIG